MIIMAAATIKQIADYFRMEGQTLTDFSKEWKALPEEDKNQLREGLGNGSLTY